MEASRESRIVTKSTLALVTIKEQLKGEDPWQAAFVLEGPFRRNLCEKFPMKSLNAVMLSESFTCIEHTIGGKKGRKKNRVHIRNHNFKL